MAVPLLAPIHDSATDATEAVGGWFIVTDIVSASPQEPMMVYMIKCVPRPALFGLKVPVDVLVMPDPDHVPPEVTAFNVVVEEFRQ